MKCTIEFTCKNPKLETIGNEIFCFNCHGLYEKGLKKPIYQSYQCCENPNIVFSNLYDICYQCGTLHEKILNEIPYLENDEYQTNILHKSKKVHMPYKYLKKQFPEIKYDKIYDFILNSINYIQDYYKLKRKPYTKYTASLYNFYRENIPNTPIIENFQNKNLILEKKIIDALYKLLNLKTNNISNYIKSNNKYNKPTDDEDILKKSYYFNKTKNKYFKKIRYCQYNKCFKIGNFKNEKNNKNYCKEHSDNNNRININNKSTLIKCNYNNCKKNIKLNDNYCSNHKFKCIDNECNIRIMKDNSYCKIHK